MPDPPLSQRADLPVRVGEVLAGKYRVERIIGYGGMGVVVAAMHEQLQELVAIKLLLPAVGKRPDYTQRFVREARAAVKIKSAHVARVLDVDTLSDGRLYMVMEYLEGKDLAQLLADRGPLPEAEAVDYVLQVCEALAAAHAIGIVHRDLKPSNLFLTDTGSGVPLVKVLDFGISKVTGELMGGPGNDARLTGESALIGSPLYMSPEQIRSARDVDARADVWALGVILHELLSRETPFIADNHAALLASIVADPPTLLREHRPDASPAIEAVIARCLEKDPSRRVQSVLELARALSAFAKEDAVPSVERALRAASRTSGASFTPVKSAEGAGGAGSERGKDAQTTLASSGSNPRVSMPAVDAMAETVNTLTEASPRKRSQRLVAAATVLGGLAAVVTAALLASRSPLTGPAGSSTDPVASGDPSVSPSGAAAPAQGSASADAPPGVPSIAPASTVQIEPPAAPSATTAELPDAGPPADAGLRPAPFPSGGKPASSTPSPSKPDGGIRLGKEVDSRH